MPISVEAEIDANSVVTLLEPVTITRKTRAIVTLLEEIEEEPQANEDEPPENALVNWLKAKDSNPDAKFPAKIIATDVPVKDRSLEYQWLEANRDEYDGKYVALDGVS